MTKVKEAIDPCVEYMHYLLAIALKEIETAETLEDLNKVRIKYLGKKGIFKQIEKALWVKPTE
jgi:hypothetical protein